jgi:regulation of enolase protein 1 (concanavalin A-like superfamily)
LIAAAVLPSLDVQADWQWQAPPNLVTMQSSRRNNVFYVGDAVAFQLNKAGASTYEIRDYYGNVVEQGPVTSGLLMPAVKAPGWYKVYLYGGDQGLPWGKSVGSNTFCILRDTPNFPKMPPAGTSGGGDLIDGVTRGVLGYGPERHKVDNASNADAEIARLDAEIARDQTYYTPFDPLRKRELLIAFPNGTTNLTGVRKIVERYKGSVKYWEARNEPNFTMGATAFVNNELKPFYQLVKSIDPSLKVMGPGAVTVGPPMAGWNDEFFRAGGAQYIDAFSFHAYNCVNGDLNLTRMSLNQVNNWLKTYNVPNLEKWQTEQGFMAPVYGAYQPRLQGRWTMLQMMVYEQYGIPKEHNHYWYDKNGGFWDEPRWLQNEDGSLNPAAVLLRVYSEELYGTNFAKAYDFGSPGNQLFVGNLFTGPNKQVAAFMTSGETSALLELTLSGATSIKVVSPMGAEQTLPVVNGKVLLPVSELPSYVEFSGTLSVAPSNWGANLARQSGVTVAVSGSATHPIDPNINNSPTKLINGQLETWYWNQNNDARLWESNSALPATVEVRFPTAQSIDRVVIYAGIPWQWDGSILDYELQVDQGGQWVSVQRIKEPVNTFRAYTDANHTTVDSYYSERCVFTHQFAPVTTQKIRLLVNDVTVGGASNQELKNAGAQGGVRQLSLREIEVYRSGSLVAQNVAPVASADSVAVSRDSKATIPVLANDSDPDNGPSPLSLVSVSTPAHGSASVSGGQVSYVPAAGYTGPDSFSYTITDGASTASGTVTVSVLSSTGPTSTDTNGLLGEYFNNADFTSPVFSRVDPYVNNNWGTGSPDPKIDQTSFSIRWTGQVQARFSETYTFSTTSDDGVRLWVNGKLLIDRWNDHPATVDQASIALVAGQRVDLKLEYYQGAGSAEISLSWSSASQQKEVVPFGALFLPSSSTPPNPPPPANIAPVAVNDSAATNEGTAVNIPVLANDSDADSGPKALSLVSVGTPARGSAVVTATGILYTPQAGFFGSDQFQYSISDGAASSTASVSVGVNSTAKALDLTSGGLNAAVVGIASGNSRILADGSWELNATGMGPAGAADALRMEAQSPNGDFRAVVRLQSVTSAGPSARVGLMLRESLLPGARTVMLAVSPANQNLCGIRSVAGGNFVETVPAGADAAASMPNAWLMMERTGDSVRLSVSSDGVNYRPVNSYTLSGLSSTVQVGLCASSGSSTDPVRGVVASWALNKAVSAVVAGQNGLLGVYYDGTNLGTPVIARVEESVNFDWGTRAPHASMNSDNFSVRWTGQVIPEYSENYTFYTQSDDGVRLWVNGQQLINNWTQHGVTEDSATIALQAGRPYEIKMEYYEAGGGAVSKLLWSSPSRSKQVIPPSALRPALVAVSIGTGSTASVASLSDGTRELTAAGTGLSGTSQDQGGFLSQPCSGDFQIAIRVRGLSGGVSPRASVMLREGMSSADRFAAIQVAADGSLSVATRSTPGASVTVTPVPVPLAFPNAWLLLERRADVLKLAVSADDITYRPAGSVNLPGLPQLVQVGAFLGSGSASVPARAVLGDYEITPLVSPGLTAQYFGTTGLSSLRLTRTDASVDFNWGGGSPDSKVSADGFSARWTGRVLPRYSQNYTFYTQSDDGVRLWVNGQLLIDNWGDHALTENTGTVSLTAGKWVDLKLEYYERAWGATARLLWSSPSQPKEVVPSSQLSTP